ncbi:MAG: hypothetical protein LUF04_05130 [Bacteroides sp.]|nr:hypothetical protein [Bacteroides sp.]
MKTTENSNDNNTFRPSYTPLSTPAKSPKEYDWTALTDFFSQEYPPHIVANCLLTAYFQLTEYMAADSDHAASEAMQESLYVLRRLYETSQQMHQPTAEEDEENNDEYQTEKENQPFDPWDALLHVSLQETGHPVKWETFIKEDFPAWVINTIVEKNDIIEKQKQEIGALSAHIETLKDQLPTGKKQKADKTPMN